SSDLMNSKNFNRRHEVDYGNSLLITYSDMVTIILCFFIVFFTMTAEEASFLEEIKDNLSLEIGDLSEKNIKLQKEKEILEKEREALKELLLATEETIDSSQSFLDFLQSKD